MVGHIGLGKYRAYNLRYEMSSKSIRIYARSYFDLPMCAIFPSDFPECAVLIGTTLLEANIIQTDTVEPVHYGNHFPGPNSPT